MGANVRHSSESAEWYSPETVVEAARALMGGIDLDPFSSDEAQEVVRAREHWSLDLLPHDFPICYPSRRLASCVVYLPPARRDGAGWLRECPEVAEFHRLFSPLGRVVVPL